jgi:ribosomal protein L5
MIFEINVSATVNDTKVSKMFRILLVELYLQKPAVWTYKQQIPEFSIRSGYLFWWLITIVTQI